MRPGGCGRPFSSVPNGRVGCVGSSSLPDTARQGSRRACVFCGATDRKITNEHMWARWLRDHIEGGHGPPQEHFRIHGTRDGETVVLDRWSAIPIDRKISGPCRPCNNGWMSRNETDAKPLLIPMLQGESVSLDTEARAILARWATLRILVAQLGHPPDRRRAIPAHRYRDFYARQALPIGAQIWAAHYNGLGDWPTSYHHVELHSSPFGRPAPATPNAYFTAFSIGHAAFVYWGHEIENGPVIGRLGGLATYLVPIWPLDDSTVNWPPHGMLGADGLQAVAKHFPIA